MSSERRVSSTGSVLGGPAPPSGEPPGPGPFFPASHSEPGLDDAAGECQEQAHEFDPGGDQSIDFVAFLSVPMFDGALAVMRQCADLSTTVRST